MRGREGGFFMAIGSRLRHVVESQQFSRPLLEELLHRADEMKRQPHHFSGRLAGQVMAALFYEPSTRTRLSFEAAMLRLGGRTMGTDNAREFSSAAKGETLEDTIRIVSGYADVIVLRHNEQGAAKRAAAVSSVPVINAGDGPGQHPTQADVIYQTRIQKERFADEGAYLALKGVYRIDASTLDRMRKEAIVMHPLPRVDEIAPEVDADPRAAYFRQARNGLYIRMALLDKVLA